MNHACEKCGAEKANKFSHFELESWENNNLEKKDYYYLCYSCFDKMTEAPLHTQEVYDRLNENRKNLKKLIEQGKVCPECKTLIVEEPHTCP